MGTKVMIAILIVALSSCVPAFSTSPGKILYLDHLHGSMKYTTVCGTDIAHPDKFGHASGGRAATGGGGRPNYDGGSQSQGGSAIPLYTAGSAVGAAGAANDHRSNHQNHSGSRRNHGCVGVSTVVFTLLACLVRRDDV